MRTGDYRRIASIINGMPMDGDESQREYIARYFADELSVDYEFNRDKFLKVALDKEV